MNTSQNLPQYKKPPVIEVVCGVQFDPLTSFSSVHFGDFWQRIKHDYPKAEDRPPLEDFQEIPKGAQLKPELVLVDAPPHRRVFYLDPTGNFLLQVQPSRFLSNWRQERPGDEYPRYTVAFDRFLKGWNAFLAFADDSGIGIPRTNHYELTYINHIPGDDAPFPANIEPYLPLFSWSSAQSIMFLPSPHSASMRLKFTFPESKGGLRVKVDHGIRKRDDKSVLVIDLTARGPAKPDWSDMEEWFGMAHEWIVRGFTDLTSHPAHLKWGRER